MKWTYAWCWKLLTAFSFFFFFSTFPCYPLVFSPRRLLTESPASRLTCTSSTSISPISFLSVPLTSEDECNVGYVKKDGSCEPCPLGTYGYRIGNGVAGCLPCPLGYFSAQPKSLECTSCGMNAITLSRRSGTTRDCFCSAGFKPKQRSVGVPISVPLDCIACESTEWCIPGRNLPYWTVLQMCSIMKQSEFCSKFSSSYYPDIRGLCFPDHLCPASDDDENISDGELCGFPYTGVKCFNCVSWHGKSLLDGVLGKCVHCIWHLLFFILIIFLASGFTLIMSYSLMGHDDANPSDQVILCRIFQQHWQHLAILRMCHIAWPKAINPVMQLITMGFPLVEILCCLFQRSQMYAAIQVSFFFPFLYLVWGFTLVSIFKKWSHSHIKSSKSEDQEGMNLSSNNKKSSNRELKHTLSMSGKLGEKTTSYVVFLFFLFHVSISSAMFYGVQCLKLEDTGFYHAVVDPNFLCSLFWGWHSWAPVGIILYVWILPVVFIGFFFYYCDDWRRSKDTQLWGYFFHGYSSEAILWQSFVILRRCFIMSLVGAGGSYGGGSIFIKFGDSQSYIQTLPESSRYGHPFIMFGVLIIFTITEMIKELVGVLGLGIAQRYVILERLSGISVILTYSSALFVKLGSTSFPYSTTMSLDISSLSSEDQILSLDYISRKEVSDYMEVSKMLGILGICLHVLFILVSLLHVLRITRTRWAISLIFKENKYSAQHSSREDLTIISRGGSTIMMFLAKAYILMNNIHHIVSRLSCGVMYFKSKRMECSTWHLEPSCASLCPLSSKIGFIIDEDVRILFSIIRFGTSCRGGLGDEEKIFAGLLRLTFEPFSRVLIPEKCIDILREEGFDQLDWTKTVKHFCHLRSLLLHRLGALKVEELKALSWSARPQCLLRYPVLEDASLQIVPPPDGLVQKVIPNEESALGIQQRNWRNFFKEPFQTFSLCFAAFSRRHASMYHVTRTSVDPNLTEELCQRILQCLLVDLAKLCCGLEYKVVSGRFLTQGVPLGTRNDGRNDGGQHVPYAKLENPSVAMTGNNSKEFSRYSGVLLRRRLTKATLAQHSALKEKNRNKNSAITNFNSKISFLDTASEKSAKLKMIQTLTDFFDVFCDARPVYHSMTGLPDNNPNPTQLMAVLQGKTFDGESRKMLEDTTVSWLDLMGNILGDLKQKLLGLDTGTSEDYIAQPEKDIDSQNVYKKSPALPLLKPLLSLICLHGEFNVDPSRIAVYATEHVRYVKGPDGCLSGIDTDVVDTETTLSHNDARGQMISIDPVVEISDPFSYTLLDGEADWTLECWIFLKEASMTSLNEVPNTKIRTLCASDKGASLFSLNVDTSQLGLWDPHQKDNPFESFDAFFHVVEPVTLDKLQLPNWFFLTVTFRCVNQDEYSTSSSVHSTFSLYLDGKLSGGIQNQRTVQNVEVIGNNCDGTQPFGTFSQLSLFPICFSEEQVQLRYKQKRRLLRHRRRGYEKTDKKKKKLPKKNALD